MVLTNQYPRLSLVRVGRSLVAPFSIAPFTKIEKVIVYKGEAGFIETFTSLSFLPPIILLTVLLWWQSVKGSEIGLGWGMGVKRAEQVIGGQGY